MTDSDWPVALSVLPARVIAKIAIREDGCWEWTGAVQKPSPANPSAGGYGRVRTCVNGVRGHDLAHRFVYKALVGPIPDDLPLDHLCHDPHVCPFRDWRCPHRRCVNPADLEPVTDAENTRRSVVRREACDDGHPFDAANTRINPKDGRQICRKCDARRAAERRTRLRGVA